MGRKGGKYKKMEGNNSLVKNKSTQFRADGDMMNDEIDAFHKNRDVVPLNMNEGMEDSDDDNEQPVLDFEDDKDEDDDVDDEDEGIDDDEPPKGLAAKITRTQKYLQAKFGGPEDEMLDDAEEEEQERVVWGRKKDMYGADVDYEPQASDDEDAAEEEAEVLKLQSEKAKVLSMEDFGLDDNSQDEADQEPTIEELLDRGKLTSKVSFEKGNKDEDAMAYERVEKDLNALTKEEQMDVVYSSAPELIGLLWELSDALEQLENKVNPFVDKVREKKDAKGGMHYMEVKQLLLESLCQAITFYLLLKSEGQPVRDHPVVSRLVEIKSLLDKVKEMDKNLPIHLEDILKQDVDNVTDSNLVEETARIGPMSLTNDHLFFTASSEKQPALESSKAAELNMIKDSSIELKYKNEHKQIGSQSKEMLKIRESLEEKLRQKGVFSSIARKTAKSRDQQIANRQLETFDDFVDEPMEIDTKSSHSSKISQQRALQTKKRKVISGDDDIPKRDDIGERRRKHELRVLARAGIGSAGDEGNDESADLSSDGAGDVNDGNEDDDDSDLEFYKQVEQQHAAKLTAKSNKYSRTPEVPSLPETVDGKRLITHQIEKNRGLTRARKKLTKNPRKKYKLKHKKAEVRRKGQVREVRKPAGPYGGETTGINTRISRSIRFNS
ncbi:protein THALLO-like [Andrographis paniculata]|uniref:protein THALLO-like n=1 Tax=Andrographis paniculata TaxID=175694 RepID=UPI0021E77B62|nr:protein THALLO-like [Andrographis paniculata]XP_051143957.1 protein THALLO-like [Andrographis paniculata]XP_051143958.1 protein THALLO-like [Andrographis paniculata]XP_051143959.1 protein THALLO-like [Andrographis paniculata]XP_051143960.1 protein THALLO-like [Andrographis paniculata]XP_051143961.1 protein THALLO-like [Andrographis paniculata]XP_051143962.1 protein THALLO-like [Andrographis paniculata]XP_051143963.1 protein THALLO-like [Andrographis paniculata]